MVASVNAEKKRTKPQTMERSMKRIDTQCWATSWVERCEAGWRSMDLIPVKLNPQDHRTGDNASLQSVHSVFSVLLLLCRFKEGIPDTTSWKNLKGRVACSKSSLLQVGFHLQEEVHPKMKIHSVVEFYRKTELQHSCKIT